jgi:hypothetical protein
MPHPFITIGLFLAAVFTALIAVFAVMKILGHFDLYKTSVLNLFSSTTNTLSNYESTSMIKMFIRHWLKAFLGFFIFSAIIAFFVLVNIKLKKNKNIRLIGYIIFFSAIFYLTWVFLWSKSTDIFLFPIIGFITVTLIKILLLSNEYLKLKTLSLMAFLLTCILSFGSDTGMTVGAYSVIFSLPLVLWYWSSAIGDKIEVIFYSNNIPSYNFNFFQEDVHKRNILTLLLLTLIAFGLPFAFRNVYRDNSLRWKMNSPVKHSMLRGVFTTPRRVLEIETLMVELDKLVEPGDILFACGNIPMINFITKTVPYLYNSWPYLYLPAEFEKALFDAKKERDFYPIIVLDKIDTKKNDWPNENFYIMSEKVKKDYKILEGFIIDGKYTVSWENFSFKILIPTE